MRGFDARPPRYDTTGVLMISVILLFAIGLPTYSMYGLFMSRKRDIPQVFNVDKVLLYLSPTYGHTLIYVVLIIRLVYSLMIAFDIARIISGVVAIFLLAPDIIVPAVQLLEMFDPLKKRQRAVHYYLHFQIIIASLAKLISLFATLLLSMAFSIIVFCNYAAIKLHHRIPMPFYLFFPATAIIVPICVVKILPKGGYIFNATQKILRMWRRHVSVNGGGYVRKAVLREVKALRPCTFYAGLGDTKFFGIKKQTVLEFMGSVMDYTVDIVLAS